MNNEKYEDNSVINEVRMKAYLEGYTKAQKDTLILTGIGLAVGGCIIDAIIKHLRK